MKSTTHSLLFFLLCSIFDACATEPELPPYPEEVSYCSEWKIMDGYLIVAHGVPFVVSRLNKPNTDPDVADGWVIHRARYTGESFPKDVVIYKLEEVYEYKNDGLVVTYGIGYLKGLLPFDPS